jgi:RNA polymerase sigma factor (sigma-70 family)
MRDEADLVAAARADPGGGGFAAIYRRYGDRIHDYCLAVLRHREDAADATQDTFLIAYQRLDQLRDPARLTAWLYAIARSRCLRRIADRKRQRPTDEWEQQSSPGAEPAGEVQRDELQQLVWDAAAGLAAGDRAVLDLHLRQGLTGAELADALGVPADKANLMLHRMKQRMRRTIGALLVARTGRADCADLAAIATGELTPLIRKRLARHIERCQVCLARRDRLAPELVYASVPLAPAPLVIGEHLTELTVATGATAAAAMRWGPDGFPQSGLSGAPPPLPQRVAIGGVVATLLVLGLLGGFVAGRTVAGDPPVVAPPGVTTPLLTTPAATPSGQLVPFPPAPSGDSAPAATGRPTSAPTATGSPTPLAPPDVTPPVLSALRLGNCGLTVTAEVDVTDTVDPAPAADLMLSWDPGPAAPVPMVQVGGNTYRATVERKGGAQGFVTFTASGIVSDAAGNSAFRQVTGDCTPVVD